MIRIFLGAALFAGLLSQPAIAAPVEDLSCLEDQLDVGERAAIGALFAEQTDDPTEERELADGSSAAAEDLAVALGGCTSRLGWDETERRAAEHYLITLGALSKIALANGDEWATAMEAYARFGARLVTEGEEVSQHQRAMIVAGAKGNGVPSKAGDESEESPIIAYVLATIDLESARTAFKIA